MYSEDSNYHLDKNCQPEHVEGGIIMSNPCLIHTAFDRLRLTVKLFKDQAEAVSATSMCFACRFLSALTLSQYFL